MSAGRNDPCPCGSGRKFKKCCGVHEPPIGQPEMVSRVISDLRRIYSGALGKNREDAVLLYTEEKKRGIREVEEDQKTHNNANGESLSCHKGCTYCCYFFADATLQECEAIVYYLYRHEDVLTKFINNYPAWKMKTKKLDSKFEELGQSLNKEEFVSRLKAVIREYHALNIPCPFLFDGACSIHEVRPWVCVGVAAVTPAQWCNPRDPNYYLVRYYSSEILLRQEPALSKPTEINSVESAVPAVVFRVLRNGLDWIV